MMFKKNWPISATLIPCAALLTTAAGCSSSSGGSARMTESQRDGPRAVSRTDSPSPQRRVYAPDNDRVVLTDDARPAPPPRSVTNDEADRSDRPLTVSEPGDSLAEQQARVTVVTAERPPLTRPEAPSRAMDEVDEFWVGGNWRGETGQYVWEPGRIEQHRDGRMFVPGNWVASAQGWEYSPEYWR